MLLLAWLFSNNRRAIRWRTVAWGLGLQLLFAFLVGSIPFGLLVGRAFYKRDIRAAGSGNIGAANALRTLGPRAGAAASASLVRGVTLAELREAPP